MGHSSHRKVSYDIMSLDASGVGHTFPIDRLILFRLLAHLSTLPATFGLARALPTSEWYRTNNKD